MSESQPNPNPSAQPPEPSWSEVLAMPLGLVGAIGGALLGGFLVKLASSSGFYAIPVVGLTVGYGTILLARRGGVVLTMLAVLVALAGSLLTEWKLWPFLADPDLGYFATHVLTLSAFKLVCHGAAAVIAGWVVWGTPAKVKKTA